jgi:hypothetical protein
MAIGCSTMPAYAVAQWLLSRNPVFPAWALPLVITALTSVALRPLVHLVTRFYRRKHAPELREAYLLMHRCPSCGYDLAGICSDNGQRTRCPECGGEWSLPSSRIVRPATN